ncbi:MAG TPA: shikimate kinase [Candidatus Thermoplasmatota archaeon]|nr:shikimate kinase [Candidatus Thermoplasmatota archaeon]
MKALATARGAVTVVNAIATGRGASLAIDLPLEAEVELLDESRDVHVTIEPDVGEDPGLARAVIAELNRRLGTSYGALVRTRSRIPASRGLKSSSAAANAIGLAANAAVQLMEGRSLPEREVLDLGVDAAVAAGVTLTGAYDDASASFLGGLCITDNGARRLFARHEMPSGLSAVLLVPARKVRKKDVMDMPYAVIAPLAARAHALALAREWPEALTLNGLAYGAVYRVDPAPALAALAAGALAAGVTGTGPAVAAVVPDAHAKAVAAAMAASGEGDVLVAAVTNARAEVRPC